jgi:hypothetical protein
MALQVQTKCRYKAGGGLGTREASILRSESDSPNVNWFICIDSFEDRLEVTIRNS